VSRKEVPGIQKIGPTSKVLKDTGLSSAGSQELPREKKPASVKVPASSSEKPSIPSTSWTTQLCREKTSSENLGEKRVLSITSWSWVWNSRPEEEVRGRIKEKYWGHGSR